MKKLMFIIRMFHGNNNLYLKIRLSQIFDPTVSQLPKDAGVNNLCLMTLFAL